MPASILALLNELPKPSTVQGRRLLLVRSFCPRPAGSIRRADIQVGLFIDLDQSAHIGPAHRPAMAGIDWTKVIGIAALVLSVAVIWFVVFAL
jgi:hypothetical protein